MKREINKRKQNKIGNQLLFMLLLQIMIMILRKDGWVSWEEGERELHVREQESFN